MQDLHDYINDKLRNRCTQGTHTHCTYYYYYYYYYDKCVAHKCVALVIDIYHHMWNWARGCSSLGTTYSNLTPPPRLGSELVLVDGGGDAPREKMAVRDGGIHWRQRQTTAVRVGRGLEKNLRQTFEGPWWATGCFVKESSTQRKWEYQALFSRESNLWISRLCYFLGTGPWEGIYIFHQLRPWFPAGEWSSRRWWGTAWR